MKDHRKAEIVNKLAAVARECAGAQQLRERVRVVVLAALEEQDRDTRHACAEAVINLPGICETPTSGSAIDPDAAHAACMNAGTTSPWEPAFDRMPEEERSLVLHVADQLGKRQYFNAIHTIGKLLQACIKNQQQQLRDLGS